jgi:hypothetical protein
MQDAGMRDRTSNFLPCPLHPASSILDYSQDKTLIGATKVSVVRVGATKQYSENWDNIFSGGKRSAAKSKSASPSKKSAKKKPAGKAVTKKSAGKAKARRAR